MTIAIAWVSKRRDGRTHLYIASDSRTRGAMKNDCSPKLLTLPRSDCAICFAGDTIAAYPLMLQLFNAISVHLPAKDRSLDLKNLKNHILRVFNDIVSNIKMHEATSLDSNDIQFLLCGYSWESKSFKIWTISYSKKNNGFSARPAVNTHKLIPEMAFIGDQATRLRSLVIQRLNSIEEGSLPSHFEYEPLKIMRDELKGVDEESSIGGAPQLVRISEDMNTKIIGVLWEINDLIQPTIMGRPLFEYENTDNKIINLDTFEELKPRSYGNR